eukprot:17877-Eustigmatos_ZCMA.PRE.1
MVQHSHASAGCDGRGGETGRRTVMNYELGRRHCRCVSKEHRAVGSLSPTLLSRSCDSATGS